MSKIQFNNHNEASHFPHLSSLFAAALIVALLYLPFAMMAAKMSGH